MPASDFPRFDNTSLNAPGQNPRRDYVLAATSFKPPGSSVPYSSCVSVSFAPSMILAMAHSSLLDTVHLGLSPICAWVSSPGSQHAISLTWSQCTNVPRYQEHDWGITAQGFQMIPPIRPVIHLTFPMMVSIPRSTYIPAAAAFTPVIMFLSHSSLVFSTPSTQDNCKSQNSRLNC
jgi:hypothetical protein